MALLHIRRPRTRAKTVWRLCKIDPCTEKGPKEVHRYKIGKYCRSYDDRSCGPSRSTWSSTGVLDLVQPLTFNSGSSSTFNIRSGPLRSDTGVDSEN